ncbi:hypothetical protein [Rubritalea tangerina]|uniref:hypothetical protein n=1 Tax=Rubritalea tangerina TaxID=430798 RepID=UPI0036065248
MQKLRAIPPEAFSYLMIAQETPMSPQHLTSMGNAHLIYASLHPRHAITLPITRKANPLSLPFVLDDLAVR